LNVNIRITTQAPCICNQFVTVSLVLDLVFSTLSVAISATLVLLTFLALGRFCMAGFGLFELGLELAALGPLF
jgi:hypothetical protein